MKFDVMEICFLLASLDVANDFWIENDFNYDEKERERFSALRAKLLAELSAN